MGHTLPEKIEKGGTDAVIAQHPVADTDKHDPPGVSVANPGGKERFEIFWLVRVRREGVRDFFIPLSSGKPFPRYNGGSRTPGPGTGR
jgi:hypothetical protein